MCQHKSSDDVVYLPPLQPSQSTVEPKRYCVECGLIHEYGGKHITYFINKLQDLGHILKSRSKRLGIPPLTTVEKRLIVKRMESLETFTDPYGVPLSRQKIKFIDLIEMHRKIPVTIIEDILT